jgi:site-specific DNA recombinase
MFGSQTLKVKKAAIYIRVSTLTQVKDGYGMEIQEKYCRDICSLKHLKVFKLYIDDGVSGTNKPSEREEMSKLMEDAKNKKFDVVVFYSLDRIAREIMITFEIINFFTNNNIEFISCKESIDNSTYQGKFKLSIYAAVSELELNTIKARLKLGRVMKRQKDGDIGGRLPYGYLRINKKIETDLSSSLVVQGIFDAFDKNKMSMNKIATILNQQGIPTPRNGKKWYASTIQSILNNRDKYNGCLINNNNNDIRWPVIPIE